MSKTPRSARRIAPATAAEWSLIALFALSNVVYLGRAVFGHGLLGPLVIGGSDTYGYLSSAKAPLFSWAFFEAPIGYPILMKLVLSNLRAIVIAQTLISIAAWTYLARAARSLVQHRWLGVATIAAILATGIAASFQVWNNAISTESLSISVMVALIASSIHLIRAPSTRTFVPFVLLAAFGCFVRDSNTVVAGFIVVVALALAIRSRAHRTALAVTAVVCVLAIAGALALSTHANRWYYPVAETISLRLLGDHDATQYLIAHGMPYDAEIQKLHTTYLYEIPGVDPPKPQYRAYLDWIHQHGKRVYTDFLKSHLRFTLLRPWDEHNKLLIPGEGGLGNSYGLGISPDRISRAVGGVAFPEVPRIEHIWMLFAIFGLAYAAWATRKTSRRREVVWLLGLVALIIPHAIVIYHADALEIGRHAITLAAQAHIATILASALALDVAFAAFAQRRQSSGSDAATE